MILQRPLAMVLSCLASSPKAMSLGTHRRGLPKYYSLTFVTGEHWLEVTASNTTPPGVRHFPKYRLRAHYVLGKAAGTELSPQPYGEVLWV